MNVSEPERPGRAADAAIDKVFADLRAGNQELGQDELSALSDLDAAGRERAFQHLRQLDPVARFAVLQRIDLAMRGAALLDFTALFLAALNDDEGSVRAAAASGLAVSEAPEAIRALIKLAKTDLDEVVRSEATVALGAAALQAEFGRLGRSLTADLIDALHTIALDVREEPEVRAAAISSAGVFSSEPWVTELVYDAYESDDPALRLGALQAMGRSADPVWMPTLVNAMHAADEDERLAAVAAAGEIADEDAVPALVDLFEDESLDVIRAALRALGEIGGSEAMEHLRVMQTHPEPALREEACNAVETAAFQDDPLGVQGGVVGPF